MSVDIGWLIGIIGTVSGVLIGWTTKGKQAKTEAKTEGERDGSMRVDMEYIKRGVDDVRVEQRMQGQRFDTLSERVTRVEESNKQAHKRIDSHDIKITEIQKG